MNWPTTGFEIHVLFSHVAQYTVLLFFKVEACPFYPLFTLTAAIFP